MRRLISSKFRKTKSILKATCAPWQYVGVNIWPYVCAPVQIMAPGNASTSDQDFKLFSKVVELLRSTKNMHIWFVKWDLGTVRLVLFSDASFENEKGFKRQLGYVIALGDVTGPEHIVHYGRNRCRCVVRSVMAAEVQGLVLGFDYASIVRNTICEIIGRKVPLEAYVDSNHLYNVVAKFGETATVIHFCFVRFLREV